MRLRAAAAALLITVGLTVPGVSASAKPSTASCSGKPGITDFNGDGVEDIAIADPKAEVAGKYQAGEVTIVYGGAAGTTQRLSQHDDVVPGGAEDGDEFGHALAVYDANGDGCSDLAVGVPYEDIGSKANAGTVQVIFGSPEGLGKGPASISYDQDQKGTPGAAEAGDWFGYALTAGTTAAGKPYLVVGVPGEDLLVGGDNIVDAGMIDYISGSTHTTVTQNSPGVPGVAETDDRYGFSLAGDEDVFAVGNPGEAIGDRTFAGGVAVFSHTFADGRPKPLAGLDQDAPGVSGAAETNDRFGFSVTLAAYRAGSAATRTSVLAVGIPGEALGEIQDAGSVQTFRITSTGDVTYDSWIQQGSSGVDEDFESGDNFGETVSAINLKPGATATAQTLQLAVGVPGEDEQDDSRDAGMVMTFPLVGSAGDGDHTFRRGDGGTEGAPGAGEYLGRGVHAAAGGLLIPLAFGKADGDKGAVYRIPWPNVTSQASEPVTAWKPGQEGLPASGRAFGATLG